VKQNSSTEQFESGSFWHSMSLLLQVHKAKWVS